MNVRDAMTKAPARCTPGLNLGAAVEILWNENSGMLPIVDEHERVISVITDRDICIALGTRNRLPGEIAVGDVATREAICCSSDEDVRSALAKMIEARVRHLPVVTAEGKLEGLVAMDDLLSPIVLKNSGRQQPASQDALTKTVRAPNSPASQGRRLNT